MADLIITNIKDPAHKNFTVLVKTSLPAEIPVKISHTKRVVSRMVEENGFWTGLVWDNGILWKFDPTITNNNESWKKN